ncbi:PAS domain-containing protein [Luteibacter sp. HA06]|jgi:PAS domain-containing protein
MSDTIDLLEAIGRDASLRHASSEELAAVLQRAKASDALTAAAASGDSSLLFDELGHKVNYDPQATQSPGYEEDEPEQDEADTSKTPSEDGKPPVDPSTH